MMWRATSGGPCQAERVEKRRRAVNEMRLAMLQEKRGALTDEEVARYRWQGLPTPFLSTLT